MFCLWTVFANSVAALTAAMHYNKQKSVSGLEQFSAAGKGIHGLCYTSRPANTKAPHNDVLPCLCITCSTMAGQKMGNTAMWEAVLPCTLNLNREGQNADNGWPVIVFVPILQFVVQCYAVCSFHLANGFNSVVTKRLSESPAAPICGSCWLPGSFYTQPNMPSVKRLVRQ